MNPALGSLVGVLVGICGTLLWRASSFGWFVDVVGGIVGACLATAALAMVGWRVPLGLAGEAILATFGAVAVLAAIRAVHRSMETPVARRPAGRRR